MSSRNKHYRKCHGINSCPFLIILFPKHILPLLEQHLNTSTSPTTYDSCKGALNSLVLHDTNEQDKHSFNLTLQVCYHQTSEIKASFSRSDWILFKSYHAFMKLDSGQAKSLQSLNTLFQSLHEQPPCRVGHRISNKGAPSYDLQNPLDKAQLILVWYWGWHLDSIFELRGSNRDSQIFRK